MNDQILRSENGLYYRRSDDGNVLVLRRNVFRQHEWCATDSIPDGCVDTTPEKEGFEMVGDVLMKKGDVPKPISMGESLSFIEDTSGGFTMAKDSNDRFVITTHHAVRHFDNWVPENAQQRRFKNMVQNLETRAMREEDEHNFNNGTVMGNFKNPI